MLSVKNTLNNNILIFLHSTFATTLKNSMNFLAHSDFVSTTRHIRFHNTTAVDT